MSDIDLAVERAKIALEEGRGADAIAIVAPYVDDGSEAWAVHQVFLDGTDMAGLKYEGRAVYETLSITDPRAATVWTWHQAGMGEAEPGDLAALVEQAPDVAPVALAWLAYGQGAPGMAVTFAGATKSAEAADVQIRAYLMDKDPVSAQKVAKAAAASYPAHPEALAGLWTRGGGSLSHYREDVLHRVVQDGLASSDPVRVYRARRLAIVAHSNEDAKALDDHLVELGEARPAIDRPVWDPSSREAAGAALSDVPLEKWPAMTPAERSRVSRSAALALEGKHRVDEALAVLAPLTTDADARALASRVALSADRYDVALAEADAALALALAFDGSDVRTMSTSLAEIHGARGAVKVAQGKQSEALVELAIAAALQPAAAWDDARTKLIPSAAAAVGPVQEASRAANLTTPEGREVLAAALIASLTTAEGAPAAVLPNGLSALAIATDAALLGTGSASQQGWTVRAPLVPAGSRAAFVAWSRAGDDDAAIAAWPYKELPLSAASEHASGLVREAVVRPATASGRPLLSGVVPEFTVTAETGPTSATALRGQVVILTFWASWCGPCMKELPATAALAMELREQGHKVTVLAVGTDADRASYARVSRREDLAPLTFAWSPELAERFGVDGIPDTWIIDDEGVLRVHHVGYGDGAEARMEREVRALLR